MLMAERDYKLTTWEAFNYILRGLVKEVINVFQIDPKIKLTAFKLWAAYLRRNEAAFFNNEEEVLPKLPACFRNQDFVLLSNMLKTRKRKHSEMVDGEPQDKHQFTKFDLQISRLDRKMLKSEDKSLIGQSMVLKRIDRKNLHQRYTKQKLGRGLIFTLIYCAINYHDPSIQVSDLLRVIREGRLSYFDCRHLLPPDLSDAEKRYINKIYTQYACYMKHKEFCISVQQLSLFCDIDLNHSNLYVLCERYVKELGLPKKLCKFVEKLFSVCPTDFVFAEKIEAHIPFYEGRAMAYIIFAMKLLFGVNGSTEIAMSKSAKSFNSFLEEQNIKCRKLFVWTEWMEYFTARKLLLMKYNSPKYFECDNECSEYNNKSTAHYLTLHTKLIKAHETRSNLIRTKETLGFKRLRCPIKRQTGLAKVAEGMKESKREHNPIKVFEFPPSLTPNTTNLEVLASNDQIYLPSVLQEDYKQRNIGYLIDSTKLKKKLQNSGFHLKTVEAHCNANVIITTNMKKDTKIKSFKKPNIRFGAIETNIDTKAFLANVKTESHQKLLNEITAKVKNDLTTKQQFSTLKENTKQVMKKKRASRKPTIKHLFDEIESSSDSEADDDTDITLLRSNFDYWTFLEYPHYITQDFYDFISAEFPESFKWLLENCSTMLEMKPIHLYFELLTVETQFLYVLKPLYKVKSEILYQDVEMLGTEIKYKVKNLKNRFTECFKIR